MDVPRLANKRFFCHNCQLSFNELVNPDKIEEARCLNCKGEFLEILENQQYHPEDTATESHKSPTRRGRYAPFFTNPRVQTELSHRTVDSGPDSGTVTNTEPTSQPPNFTRIEVGPFGYRIHTVTTSHAVPASSAMHHEEERKAPRTFIERTFTHNMPHHINHVHSDMQDMEWGHGLTGDPFEASYLGGSIFGRSFPGLRINDFFSEEDDFFPTSLGINLQDFGLNFASNFRRTNLIDLSQLFGMFDAGNAGRPPTSTETLSKLPVFKIEEKHCKKNEKGELEVPNCAICCSDISLGQNAQLLPCGHMFHPDCTRPWLTQHNTCPICRYELPTDDPYYEEIRRRNASHPSS